MKEYIITDEMGNDFPHKVAGSIKGELIRCKDCARNDNCFMYRESGNDYGYCAWAHRRKE